MMKSATINRLSNTSAALASAIIEGVKHGLCSRLEDGNNDLRHALKKTIRVNCSALTYLLGINLRNVLKTPRQLNYLLSESEYHLRRLNRKMGAEGINLK